MFVPSSAIYRSPEVGEGLSDSLFDRVEGSSKRKEVRPFRKHVPARGTLPIRSLGGYRANESDYQKL